MGRLKKSAEPRPDRLDLASKVLRLAAWATRAKYTHGSIVLLVSGQQLLLVEQKFRERGRWGLPGGFMNVEETPTDAALRELREETAIEVASFELQEIHGYRQPWAWHWDHLFLAEIDPSDSRASEETLRINRELSAARWWNLQKLPKLTLAATEALRRWRDDGALS